MADAFSMKAWELAEIARTTPGILGFWPVNDFVAAHKFLFGEHRDLPSEMFEFGAQLAEMGIFSLPFRLTVMEFLTSESQRGGGNVERVVLLCREDRTLDDTPGTISEDGSLYKAPRHISVFPIVRTIDGEWQPIVNGGPPVIIWTGNNDKRNRIAGYNEIYNKRRGWDKIAYMAASCCEAGVVALMSKSCKRTDIDVPLGVAKKRKILGRPPIYSFSVVSVPSQNNIIAAQVKGKHITHASPRLHWRRGHYRRLRGRLFPVAPCLVGRSDLGTIAKAYDARTSATVTPPATSGSATQSRQ